MISDVEELKAIVTIDRIDYSISGETAEVLIELEVTRARGALKPISVTRPFTVEIKGNQEEIKKLKDKIEQNQAEVNKALDEIKSKIKALLELNPEVHVELSEIVDQLNIIAIKGLKIKETG